MSALQATETPTTRGGCPGAVCGVPGGPSEERGWRRLPPGVAGRPGQGPAPPPGLGPLAPRPPSRERPAHNLRGLPRPERGAPRSLNAVTSGLRTPAPCARLAVPLRGWGGEVIEVKYPPPTVPALLRWGREARAPLLRMPGAPAAALPEALGAPPLAPLPLQGCHPVSSRRAGSRPGPLAQAESRAGHKQRDPARRIVRGGDRGHAQGLGGASPLKR